MGSCGRRDWQKEKKRKKNCKGDARGEGEEQFQSGTNPHLGKGRHLGRGRGVALRPAPRSRCARGSPEPRRRGGGEKRVSSKSSSFQTSRLLVVRCRPTQSPQVRAPNRSGHRLPAAGAARRKGGSPSQRATPGEYLSRNESFIHGFRPVLGQKQRALVHQTRFRLHDSPPVEPQGGCSNRTGSAHAQSRLPPACGGRKPGYWREKASRLLCAERKL